ncbi:DNA-processing protein DprA [Halanaerocella petrolearia]
MELEGKLYWMWLTKVPKLGPRRIKKLLDYFKDAKGIWTASREELNNVSGIGPSISGQIIESKDKFNFARELEQLKQEEVKVVTLGEECYPKLLKEIYDPPPVLYYKGELINLELPCIAIVGSRKCTDYGRQVAKRLSQRLAEIGISVISGLARGIDTAAHQGALHTGSTSAILGSGLDRIYPPENKGIAKQITTSGSLLTPFPLGTSPEAKHFPARNRIISGLSLGTIVVEAAQKSGSLITANLALEQGREVFAIPGDITKKQSIGTNDLIKTGAKLVQDIDDILVELPIKNNRADTNVQTKIDQNRIHNLSKKQKQVYRNLSISPQQFETVINSVDLDSAQLNSVLLELEVKGLVEQLPGRKFKLRSEK